MIHLEIEPTRNHHHPTEWSSRSLQPLLHSGLRCRSFQALLLSILKCTSWTSSWGRAELRVIPRRVRETERGMRNSSRQVWQLLIWESFLLQLVVLPGSVYLVSSLLSLRQMQQKRMNKIPDWWSCEKTSFSSLISRAVKQASRCGPETGPPIPDMPKVEQIKPWPLPCGSTSRRFSVERPAGCCSGSRSVPHSQYPATVLIHPASTPPHPRPNTSAWTMLRPRDPKCPSQINLPLPAQILSSLLHHHADAGVGTCAEYTNQLLQASCFDKSMHPSTSVLKTKSRLQTTSTAPHSLLTPPAQSPAKC